MAALPVNKQFWTEFINLYKCLPALWNTKSLCYKNKIIKRQEFMKLLTKLKQIQPDATLECVKAKIGSFRASYRRELRKVRAINAEADEKYVPQLWYFNLLEFLSDENDTVLEVWRDETVGLSEGSLRDETVSEDSLRDETIFEGSLNDSDEAEETITEQLTKRADGNLIGQPQSPDSVMATNKCAVKRPLDQTTELVATTNELVAPTNEHVHSGYYDEADALGRVWASEYKKLKPDQQLFAKKAINDVLFEGRFGTLSRYSVRINDTPQFTHFSTHMIRKQEAATPSGIVESNLE